MRLFGGGGGFKHMSVYQFILDDISMGRKAAAM